MKTLTEITDKAKKIKGKKISLAGADNLDALLALEQARTQNIADAILVGDKDEIIKTANTANINIKNYEIVHEPNKSNVAKRAVEIIHEGRANALMKGLVSTADFMHAILNKSSGLMASKLLSHIALFEVKNYHKLLCITDAAINIEPILDHKKSIIQNAIEALHKLGIDKPKVACVCAVEKVNPKMQCTVDADLLSQMSRNGDFNGAVVEGPFGLDNAIDKEAAQLKGIKGDVAGDADIIFCPEITSANVLYKSLAYLGKYNCGAIVLGASVPVILTSRADTDYTKFASIALAIAIS